MNLRERLDAAILDGCTDVGRGGLAEIICNRLAAWESGDTEELFEVSARLLLIVQDTLVAHADFARRLLKIMDAVERMREKRTDGREWFAEFVKDDCLTIIDNGTNENCPFIEAERGVACYVADLHNGLTAILSALDD